MNGNQARSARILGITRGNLRKKIRAHGISLSTLGIGAAETAEEDDEADGEAIRAIPLMSRSGNDVELIAVDGSRRLTRYYVLALSAVALLSIAGQLFVQSRLIDQLGDSKLVNTAGRQRMLSQRIVKCALVLQTATTTAERETRRAELQSSLRQWRRKSRRIERRRRGRRASREKQPRHGGGFCAT